MSKIIVNNLSLHYPIYGAGTRSLKNDIVKFLTAKKLKQQEHSNVTYVSALKNISFTLEDGDNLGLIGNNGAGKSTLLKVLSGIYEPYNLESLSVTGEISSLLGGAVGMQPELTGYENIRINSIIKRYSKEKTQHIITDIEEFSELGEFLSLPVKTYSAGMTMRLAFGIATAIVPDILLLDEMVSTGDNNFMQKASNRMKNLVAKSNILVLASHSTDILKQFCNKLLWLEKGEIRGFGPIDDILHQYHAA